MAGPQGALITYNAGPDNFLGGQLIEDTGVISDLDGGFDTATLVIFYRSGDAGPTVGDPHPDYSNMFLFGRSPQRLPGGDRRITLTYKGLSTRQTGGGALPAEGGTAGKFTYGIKMAEKTWGKGDLSGTVDGVTLSSVAVNVQQPQKTVRVAWVGTAPFSSSIFNMPNGKSPQNFTGIGAIDQTFYPTLANAAYNFPNGWIPTEASAEQAVPGKGIWLNSVTFVGIPKFSAA